MTLRSTDMTGGPPLCGLRSSEKNPFPIYVKVCCMNKEKIVLCDRKACTGCSACYATCPTGAVCMEADEEGFFIPRIDYDRCTGCQRCNAVCPVLRRNEPPADIRPLVLAAWHRDQVVRLESSSGGVFSALAETVLAQGGVVFGAAYDEHLRVHHIFIDSIGELSRLRGSKYVQSDLENSFREVRSFLRRKRMVLFVGTPCQITGLVHFIGAERCNHLITCDFACHGVPSPLFFKEYLQWLAEHLHSKPENFKFRDKSSGWYDALRFCYSQGHSFRITGKLDCYFHAFNRNLVLRNSCYQCPTNGLERVSDITIGDFWGVGRQVDFPEAGEIKDGISLILLHTERGSKLLQEAQNKLYICERSLDEALAGNAPLIHSSCRPQEREKIFRFLRENGFEKTRRYFLGKSLKERIIAGIREYMPRKFVLFIRGRIP